MTDPTLDALRALPNEVFRQAYVAYAWAIVEFEAGGKSWPECEALAAERSRAVLSAALASASVGRDEREMAPEAELSARPSPANHPGRSQAGSVTGHAGSHRRDQYIADDYALLLQSIASQSRLLLAERHRADAAEAREQALRKALAAIGEANRPGSAWSPVIHNLVHAALSPSLPLPPQEDKEPIRVPTMWTPPQEREP